MAFSWTKTPDGGWGWIVTCACFIENFLCIGMMNTMGIYYTYIMEEFDVGLSSVTVIGAVYSAMCFAGAVLAIPLAEKFGDRPVVMVGGIINFIGFFSSSYVKWFPGLYVTKAIIPGIGNSFAYPILFTSVDRYFDKKKYIAMAIGIVGVSAGTVTLPPLSEFLLSTYGFQDTILIHSAMSLHVVLCGAVIFPLKYKEKKSEVKKNDDNGKKCENTTSISFCKTPRYISYLSTNFLFMVALYIPGTQVPKTAVSIGVDITDISFAVSMGGISSGCGRICFGVLCHYFKYHIIKLWTIFLVAMGAAMMIIPFSTTYSHFLIFYILYGFLEGGNNVGWNLSQKNLIKPHQYGRSISIVLLVEALGVAIGSPLTAYFNESLDIPGIPYYIGTTISVLGAVIICPFSRIKMEHITDDLDDLNIVNS